MGLANLGFPSLILIIIVALIIFGPKKLPEIGKATGQTFHEFKKSMNELVNDDDETKTTREKESENIEKKDI